MRHKNDYTYSKHLNEKKEWLAALFSCIVALGLTAYLIYDLRKGDDSPKSTCAKSSERNNSGSINLDNSKSGSIEGKVPLGKVDCFSFSAQAGQSLDLDTNVALDIISPDGSMLRRTGESQELLKKSGIHYLRISGKDKPQTYSIDISLTESISDLTQSTELPSEETAQPSQDAPNIVEKVSYNVKTLPQLSRDQNLDGIVSSAVSTATAKGLSTQQLSITLINLKDDSFAEFNGDKPLFPASVVKLFWLVALFGHFDAGQNFQGIFTQEDLFGMMQNSDNNPASLILDKVTDTESGKELPRKELLDWLEKRESINDFFRDAGYADININQKNFPVPDLSLERPEGREKQMRGENESSPIRNSLTSFSVARLLFEIEEGQAISPEYSQLTMQLMKRDFVREQSREWDAIRGFLGDGLDPTEVELYSKPGWTEDSRQDATIVYSVDQQVCYILVIFGSDPGYAEDEDIFPELSEYIYSQMSKLSRR
jgi:hypothetical protein